MLAPLHVRPTWALRSSILRHVNQDRLRLRPRRSWSCDPRSKDSLPHVAAHELGISSGGLGCRAVVFLCLSGFLDSPTRGTPTLEVTFLGLKCGRAIYRGCPRLAGLASRAWPCQGAHHALHLAHEGPLIKVGGQEGGIRGDIRACRL